MFNPGKGGGGEWQKTAIAFNIIKQSRKEPGIEKVEEGRFISHRSTLEVTASE